MAIADDAVEARAQGWRTLAALHGKIEDRLEKALQKEHELSVSEYTVLDVLARQDGWHMRMQQLARAVVLSQSATTRLVTRLENRGLLRRYLCEDDRRGIYSEVTPPGRELLELAGPTHDTVLKEVLAEAAEQPELAPLARVLS
ncbi:MarR family winged helix-turn-helix transcriptional regulator [Nonomuraea insulae]|uniref:MarR family winged helix-turn-helix transcriptional regulator n=1 Tax=Nonomuraea insulae TaxID=1616787 RepID=A0ABW1CMH2_9ACTN